MMWHFTVYIEQPWLMLGVATVSILLGIVIGSWITLTEIRNYKPPTTPTLSLKPPVSRK